MPYTDTSEPVHIDASLAVFSDCHHDFVAQLHSALYLPELVTAAAKARTMSNQLLVMFRDAVAEHHAEEERELFPAVLRAAEYGAELDEARAMVEQLVREHRQLEEQWSRLRPSVEAVANGDTPELDAALIQEMVQHFFAHAHLEEQQFLPMAQKILGRHGEAMAALGRSLHERHAPAQA